MGARSSVVKRVKRRGKTVFVIDFSFIDKTGKKIRYRHDATVQLRAAAEAEAQRLQVRAAAEGTLEEAPAAQSFEQFVSEVFRPVFLPRARKATQVRYEALLKQGILEHFGELSLDAVTGMQLRAYAVTLEKRDARRSIRAHWGLIRTILRAGVEAGALSKFPDLPKLPPAAKKLPDCPSMDYVIVLLSKATGWIRLAIALATYAGLRQGEVRAIERRDVDLKGGVLRIRRAFSEDVLTTPKSGAERVIPIAQPLLPFLLEAIEGKSPDDTLVKNRKGKTPTRQQVLTSLVKTQTRHGLHSWSFHSLRHAFCSSLVRLGASVEAIRLLAGHSALQVTQRYVHATAADLSRTIDLFGNSVVTVGGVDQK